MFLAISFIPAWRTNCLYPKSIALRTEIIIWVSWVMLFLVVKPPFFTIAPLEQIGLYLQVFEIALFLVWSSFPSDTELRFCFVSFFQGGVSSVSVAYWSNGNIG